jgi:hypothetical protein
MAIGVTQRIKMDKKQKMATGWTVLLIYDAYVTAEVASL